MCQCVMAVAKRQRVKGEPPGNNEGNIEILQDNKTSMKI